MGYWSVYSYAIQRLNQHREDGDHEVHFLRGEARTYSIARVCVSRCFILASIFASGDLDCDFRPHRIISFWDC